MKRAGVLALCTMWLVGAGCSTDGNNTFRITAQPQSSGAEWWSALYQTTAARRTEGNRFQVVLNGDVFDVLEAEISKATRSVNIVLFIWRSGDPSDRIVKVLTERARAGVKCRVLVDPVGSTDFEDKVKPALEGAGCETFVFRPIPGADEELARNHRKIAIIDGKVGITGGFGIYKSWLGDGRSEDAWRDTNLRAEGPVVTQMQQAFAENWQEACGEILPLEDFPELDPNAPASASSNTDARSLQPGAAFVGSTASPEVTRAERLTQLVVQAAHHRLLISQAYFTPNDVLAKQLQDKARAGVQIWVLAPGDKNDQPEITVAQRHAYDDLLAAGVRIWEYQPAMMHAKTMLADDDLSVIGSINYDPLSFNLLEEGSLVTDDRSVAQALEKAFNDDLQYAKEVHR